MHRPRHTLFAPSVGSFWSWPFALCQLWLHLLTVSTITIVFITPILSASCSLKGLFQVLEPVLGQWPRSSNLMRSAHRASWLYGFIFAFSVLCVTMSSRPLFLEKYSVFEFSLLLETLAWLKNNMRGARGRRSQCSA